jgi:two-component system sensor histidine kinase TctE
VRTEPASLRARLLRGLLAPLSLLLLAGMAGAYLAARAVADHVYDGELAEIGRELLLHVRHDAAGAQFDLSPEAERTLLLDEYDRVSYAVRAPGGATLAGSAALPLPPRAPAAGKTEFGDGEVGGRAVRIASLQAPGGALVQVAETRVKRARLTEELLLGFALPQVVLIAAAGLLLWWGVARGLAPLERLRADVAARSHLDMSPVAAGDAPAEVRPLVAAVNELMQRLNGVLESQGRFIADTAHQLRTPVAGLKAHIEVALREEDLAQTRRALAHLYVSAERLAHLVAQLLSLARNEPHAASTRAFAPLDLNKLAFDTTMEWVAQAYAKDIDLGFEGAERPAMIRGDRVRLTELLNNLVDNAIRYTRHGGRVTVRVTPQGRPCVSVSDDGPKIPPEEREHVFERFHRLLGTQAEGSGLGLAIVRDIATLHQASITLEDDADGIGNTFTVSFPPEQEITAP